MKIHCRKLDMKWAQTKWVIRKRDHVKQAKQLVNFVYGILVRSGIQALDPRDDHIPYLNLGYKCLRPLGHHSFWSLAFVLLTFEELLPTLELPLPEFKCCKQSTKINLSSDSFLYGFTRSPRKKASKLFRL